MDRGADIRTIPIALTLAWLTIGVFTAGCNNGSGTSDTLTGPTATVTTENFSGTVSAGETTGTPFTISLSNGQVNAILTAAGRSTPEFRSPGIRIRARAGEMASDRWQWSSAPTFSLVRR